MIKSKPASLPSNWVVFPYAREVSAEFAQRPNNLTTTLAGDPLFVGTFVAPVRMGAQHFAHAASMEYMNDMLKLPGNTHTMDRNTKEQADTGAYATAAEAALAVARHFGPERIAQMQVVAVVESAKAGNDLCRGGTQEARALVKDSRGS